MAAIYTPIWLIAEQFTTTLYPVVVVDSMGLTIQIDGGAMSLVPESTLEHTFDAQNGTYVQLRWFYTDGPYDSGVDNTFDAQDGTYIQLRWFYTDGPYDSGVDNTFAPQNGTLINKLVIADTPDEELQMALVIEATSTMDLI